MYSLLSIIQQTYLKINRTGAWQHQQNDLWHQWRYRSARASASSDQWSLCTLLVANFRRTSKTGRMQIHVFTGCTGHFVGFVVIWLSCVLSDWSEWVRMFRTSMSLVRGVWLKDTKCSDFEYSFVNILEYFWLSTYQTYPLSKLPIYWNNRKLVYRYIWLFCRKKKLVLNNRD